MDKINEYYDQCYRDYRLIWQTGKNFSIHMGFYDSKNSSHDKAVIRMNEVLASKVKITEADIVLDAGCGIGGSTIWLAKNVGCNVTGINISSSQLENARTLIQKENLDSRIGLYEMDFCNSEFTDGSFDVVWALESSCYAVDKHLFLKEAKRLLKPGGRLVIADGFVVEAHSDVDTWLSGWAVPNLANAEKFTEYLEALGFENIVWDDISENVLLSSARLHRHAVILYPVGRAMEMLGIRSKVQTANIISAIYQYRTLVRGLWKYCVVTAKKEY